MRTVKQGIAAYEKAKALESGAKKTEPHAQTAAERGAKQKAKKDVAQKQRVPSDAIEGFLKSPGGVNGFRKAAKFLLLVGKEEAAKILKHFKPEEVELITREIAGISHIEAAEAEKLLSEFGFLKEKAELPVGGRDAARSMLVAAFGEEKGDALFHRIVPYAGEKPFSFLNDLEIEQIRVLLKSEPVQVVALVVPFLEPKKASSLITSFDPETQKEIVRRIARMQRIAPEAIQKTEVVLMERIRTQGKVVTRKIDGSDTLAKILKYMDTGSNEMILKNLSEVHPEISDAIKEKIFTIDIVLSLSKKDLNLALHDLSDRDIAVILKGKNEAVRTKILEAVSERRRSLIESEGEYLGAMKKSDVDAATREFVDHILELESKGKITLERDSETYV